MSSSGNNDVEISDNITATTTNIGIEKTVVENDLSYLIKVEELLIRYSNYCSQSSIYMAHQIYLDLMILKNWYKIDFDIITSESLVTSNIKSKDISNSNIVILKALESNDTKASTIIFPTKITTDWSFEKLNKLIKESGTKVENEVKSIILCWMDQDSSISYYRLSKPALKPLINH